MHLKRLGLLAGLVFLCSIAGFAGPVHTTVDELGAVKIVYPGTHYYAIGSAVCGAGDFDGDGYLDAAIGAPLCDTIQLSEKSINGAVFILSGKHLSRDTGTIDLSANYNDTIVAAGDLECRIGSVLAQINDVNLDGCDDLAIGSASHQAGYILFGRKNPNRTIELGDLQDGGVVIKNTGYSAASASDFNGDGYPDVLFGNPYSEVVTAGNKKFHIGQISIIYGRSQFPPPIGRHLFTFIDSRSWRRFVWNKRGVFRGS